MQHLPVEVADVDVVPVAEPEARDPRCREVERCGASEPPKADDERRGRGEAGLGWGEEEREGKREREKRKKVERKRQKKNFN